MTVILPVLHSRSRRSRGLRFLFGESQEITDVMVNRYTPQAKIFFLGSDNLNKEKTLQQTELGTAVLHAAVKHKMTKTRIGKDRILLNSEIFQ